jgi:hypothetical protein
MVHKMVHVEAEAAKQWCEKLRTAFVAKETIPRLMGEVLCEMYEEEDPCTESAEKTLEQLLPDSWWRAIFRKGTSPRISTAESRGYGVFEGLSVPRHTAVAMFERYAEPVSSGEEREGVCFGLPKNADSPMWKIGNAHALLADDALLFFRQSADDPVFRRNADEWSVVRMTEDATPVRNYMLSLLIRTASGDDADKAAKALGYLKVLFWEAWNARKQRAERRFDEAVFAVPVQRDDASSGVAVYRQADVFVFGDVSPLARDHAVRRVYATHTLHRDSAAARKRMEEAAAFSNACLSQAYPEDIRLHRRTGQNLEWYDFLDFVEGVLRTLEIPQIIIPSSPSRIHVFTHQDLVER